MRIWIWISAALAVVCVGLLVWALSLQSDLDDSEQQVADLQAQVDQAAQGGDLRKALKGGYDALVAQLGATQTDVTKIQQDIEQAKANVRQAQEDAKTAAAAAGDDVEARVAQAQATAEVAKGQAKIAADCGQAYLSALGSLFSGGDVTGAREQLQAISADCRTALSGS